MMWKKELEKTDLLIKGGNAQAAQNILSIMMKSEIPRIHFAELASLLRRSGLTLKAAKLLNRIVNDQSQKRYNPTDDEKTEYAAALNFLGATHEARGLLRGVDAKRSPKKLLFEAYTYTCEWEGRKAIPLLKQYEQVVDNEYDKIICDVNLALSQIQEGLHTAAEATLQTVKNLCCKKEYTLLYGNALQLAAANAILMKKWNEVEKTLSEAENVLAESNRVYLFLVHKWRVVAEVLKTQGGEKSLHALNEIRNKAIKCGELEVIRDCDRFEAIATHNKDLFHKAYFGTPYPHFRERMLQLYQHPIEIPHEYHWQLGKGSSQIDLSQIDGLKTGSLLHRIFVTLASDFYRPFRSASLYAALFPDEHFNPLTSINRIHFSIARARKFLEKKGLPINIKEVGGAYQLESNKGVRIRVTISNGRETKKDLVAEKIYKDFDKQTFSASELSKTFNVSLATALRILSRAQLDGFVSKTGNGSKTRYQYSHKRAA